MVRPDSATIYLHELHEDLPAKAAAIHVLQLAEVDVALERMLSRRIMRLGNDHIHERAAGQFLVPAVVIDRRA